MKVGEWELVGTILKQRVLGDPRLGRRGTRRFQAGTEGPLHAVTDEIRRFQAGTEGA